MTTPQLIMRGKYILVCLFLGGILVRASQCAINATRDSSNQDKCEACFDPRCKPPICYLFCIPTGNHVTHMYVVAAH